MAGWPSGNVDYAPLKAWEYRESHGKTMGYLYVDGQEIEKTPSVKDSGTVYIQELDVPRDGAEADIPVFRYYGQKVLLNGEPAEAEMSGRGTTAIGKLPAGKAVIEISYRYTALARASWLFSIIVLMYATISGALKRKKDREQS